jgi:serine/threonine-protein kinase
MVTTDLGACEWFVWDLRRSNLIDRGQLDQIVGEFLQKNPGAEPPQLAEHLTQLGALTEFQAERLLQGKTQGFVLGPFTLMDALGTGSMGTVYKAHNKNDNAWYAVKVLPRRSMWNVRIARRKVRSFEQVKNPSVVPFVDVGTAGGMHYLAWPLVEGKTLEKVVAERGKLPADEAARYAVQAAEGLQAAQDAGLFHGLLKPSNLMICPDGQVKILDFGIGCLLAETEGESLVDTMSTANSVNSGLDCASPESIMDPTNLSSVGDQYSLGCVLYFCLTGQYPFPDGTAVEKMMCHQAKQPMPIRNFSPEVPYELCEVIEKLMAKAPTGRFPSTAEAIEALRPFTTTGETPPATQRRPTMQMPRVKLSKPADAPAPTPSAAAPEPPRPAPAAPARPLPPRSPSAVAAAAQKLPARADLARKPALEQPAKAAPAPANPPVPAVEQTPEPRPSRPRRSPGGNALNSVAIVIIAVLCGVAAFFISKMVF